MDHLGKFDEIVEQDGIKVVIVNKSFLYNNRKETDLKEDALRYVSQCFLVILYH